MASKSILIAIVERLILVLISPLIVAVKLQRSTLTRTTWFQFCGDFLSIWPFQIGAIARSQFYRHTLEACGTNFRTKFGVSFVHPGARIGNNVRFGRYTSVGLSDVEDDVMVAHFCSIMSGRRHHRTDLTDTPMRAQDGVAERIRIGKGSWIGANAIVMADIGEGVVVGAGAVVVKPMPDYAVVVGNPARIVKFRTDQALSSAPDEGAAESSPAEAVTGANGRSTARGHDAVRSA